MNRVFTIGFTLHEDAHGYEKGTWGMCMTNDMKPICTDNPEELKELLDAYNEEFPEAEHYVCELVRVKDE